MDEEDNLFSRWSRRKRRVADETTAAPKAVEVFESNTEIVEPVNDEEEAKLLAELGLPRPESLKEGDDFSAFMQSGVPQFLRKRALRVLWRSNPVLANLDGLNDYDEDFTSPEMTQKVLATAYQVGRGIVRDVTASLDKADDESQEVRSAEIVETDEIEKKPIDVVEAQHAPAEVIEPEVSEQQAFRPTRMRFDT